MCRLRSPSACTLGLLVVFYTSLSNVLNHKGFKNVGVTARPVIGLPLEPPGMIGNARLAEVTGTNSLLLLCTIVPQMCLVWILFSMLGYGFRARRSEVRERFCR